MTLPRRGFTFWAITLKNGGGRLDGARMAQTCRSCSTPSLTQVLPRGDVNVREAIVSGTLSLKESHGASTVETVDHVPG